MRWGGRRGKRREEEEGERGRKEGGNKNRNMSV